MYSGDPSPSLAFPTGRQGGEKNCNIGREVKKMELTEEKRKRGVPPSVQGVETSDKKQSTRSGDGPGEWLNHKTAWGPAEPEYY